MQDKGSNLQSQDLFHGCFILQRPEVHGRRGLGPHLAQLISIRHRSKLLYVQGCQLLSEWRSFAQHQHVLTVTVEVLMGTRLVAQIIFMCIMDILFISIRSSSFWKLCTSNGLFRVERISEAA